MEDYNALLKRLRAPSTRQPKAGRTRVEAAPPTAESEGLSTPARSMTELLRKWTETESNSLVVGDGEKRSSPPLPPAPSAKAPRRYAKRAVAAAATPQSAFAPRANSLPPLLRDTIGRGEGARAGLAMSAASRPFSCVVVDLETTGFSPDRNEIVEVGCVELRWNPPVTTTAALHVAGEVDTLLPTAPSSLAPTASQGFWALGARSFHRYVRPSSPAAMSAASTAVHGITWDAVKDSEDWPKVARDLTHFLHGIAMGNRPASACTSNSSLGERNDFGRCTLQRTVQLPPLVAHNASFDAAFLERHLQRCGYHVAWDAGYPLMCSMKWSRKAYPHVASNLNSICAFFMIDGAAERAAGFHGAFVDATITAKLFLQLCRHWEENTIKEAC